jgi:alkaline phosphatase D
MKKICTFLVLLASFYTASAQLPPLPPHPALIHKMGPFYHGVASGDPLSDRVILWTRVTPTVVGSISVTWQIATDTLFSHVINSGTTTADSSRDYTVKVDATGLSQNTWYYYRFKAMNVYSITGRTRTIPTGNTDSLRYAVFSCSDFQGGFFNVYNDISRRNDLDLLIHLGDWYYEYKGGGWDYNGDTGRMHPILNDALTLGDYRLQESMYKLDNDVALMLEQYPIIQLWDDHEVCDNAWSTNGLNHDYLTQGAYIARKNAAKKAFMEWNPIRPMAAGNDSTIYRNFKWGNLLNLIMVDSRLQGRDSALGSMISYTDPYMNTNSRSMLGTTQLAWLKTQLSDVSTQWKIVGNQVMVAPLYVFGSVANGDQWDGYPAERKRIFDHISSNNIKDVVFLSGDLHTSWAGDVPDEIDSTYVSSTGAGSIGTEFIGSSVTAASSYSSGAGAIMLENPWFKYVEFTLHGYLVFDVNKTRAQGDYVHVNTILSKTYSTTNDAQWMNLNNERHLRLAPAALGPNLGNPPLITFKPMSVPAIEPAIVVFTCYPNPASSEVTAQFYLTATSNVSTKITDISGRILYTGISKEMPRGINNVNINLNGFANGIYLLSISTGSDVYTQRIEKIKQ